MIDLEARLRALDDPGSRPAPSAAALRGIAGRRRRRRRALTVIAVAAVVIIVGTLTAFALTDDRAQQVTVGPPDSSTTTEPRNPASRALGGLIGVEVDVTPSTELVDGQIVDVHIEGLDRIPGAAIVMCAGDVTEADATASCDFAAITNPSTGESAQVVAQPDQSVAVARTLSISRDEPDPNESKPYDCATEPAGCVLAVGPLALPVRAVLVPLTFQNLPLATPTASASPTTGLRAGQETTLTAEGLRPNESYGITQCRLDADGWCDVLDFASAFADGEGRVSVTTRAWASIYRYDGRVDCTTEPCAVALTTVEGEVVVRVPVTFASDVVAPVPFLSIEPAGPYVDQQEITVHGSGFRPGHDMAGQIGQCPADKDTATEERCGYDLRTSVAGVVVDATGRFATTVRLSDQLTFTGTCRGAPGCLLGWVIPHGTTLAKVPLTFR